MVTGNDALCCVGWFYLPHKVINVLIRNCLGVFLGLHMAWRPHNSLIAQMMRMKSLSSFFCVLISRLFFASYFCIFFPHLFSMSFFSHLFFRYLSFSIFFNLSLFLDFFRNHFFVALGCVLALWALALCFIYQKTWSVQFWYLTEFESMFVQYIWKKHVFCEQTTTLQVYIL